MGSEGLIMDIKKQYRMLYEAIQSNEVERVPEGWVTCNQFSEETGKSVAQVSKILSKGVKENRVEVKRFKIKAGDRVYPVLHYKIK